MLTFPPWVRYIGAGLILAALIAATVAAHQHVADKAKAAERAAGYAVGHAEWQALQTEMTERALAGERKARAAEQNTAKTQKENADEAQRLGGLERARLLAAADRAAAASGRVQLAAEAAASAASSGVLSSDSAAARQCVADLAAAARLLAAARRVLGQAHRDADLEVAESVRHNAECVADYETVRKNQP